MKIQQVLKTKVIVNLDEIPHIPAGFKLTGAGKYFDQDRLGSVQFIELEGEIQVTE